MPYICTLTGFVLGIPCVQALPFCLLEIHGDPVLVIATTCQVGGFGCAEGVLHMGLLVNDLWDK